MDLNRGAAVSGHDPTRENAKGLFGLCRDTIINPILCRTFRKYGGALTKDF